MYTWLNMLVGLTYCVFPKGNSILILKKYQSISHLPLSTTTFSDIGVTNNELSKEVRADLLTLIDYILSKLV